MQFIAIVATAFAALAAASPVNEKRQFGGLGGESGPTGGLGQYCGGGDRPECCGSTEQGLLGTGCSLPAESGSTIYNDFGSYLSDFQKACGSLTPACCLADTLSLGVECQQVGGGDF